VLIVSNQRFNSFIVIGFFSYLEFWFECFIKRIESQPQYAKNGKADVPSNSGLPDPPKNRQLITTALVWTVYGLSCETKQARF